MPDAKEWIISGYIKKALNHAEEKGARTEEATYGLALEWLKAIEPPSAAAFISRDIAVKRVESLLRMS